MSSKIRNKSKAGFTIIEVLIVLAIAGLILLIVFLAVPALNRNARNTSLKSDVQNTLGGVAEFQGANNGKLPQNIDDPVTGTVTYKLSAGGVDTTTSIQGATKVTTVTTIPTDVPAGEIQIVLGKKCSVNGAAPVSNSRAVSAYYSIETATKTALQCTDS